MARPSRTSVLPILRALTTRTRRTQRKTVSITETGLRVSLVSFVVNQTRSMPGKKYPISNGGRLRCIRSMRRVTLDRLRELLAERPGVGLGRVGRAHQRPPLLDGVRRLQNHDNRRPGGHELGQAREERTLAMDGVEPLGLAFRQVQPPHGTNLESLVLDAVQNPAGELPLHRVRLDNGQRPLGHPAIIAGAISATFRRV